MDDFIRLRLQHKRRRTQVRDGKKKGKCERVEELIITLKTRGDT